MLDELRHCLNAYEVIPITECNYKDAAEVFETNKDFFLLTEGKESSLAGILGSVTAVPKGFCLKDKYFTGIWKNGSIIAVLDFLKGFPDKDCVWIGLLLVRGGLKGQSIGTEIAQAVLRASKNTNHKQIKLGVIDNNAKGIDFWVKMGFAQADAQSNILIFMREI
ncbi:MAG: GNAT family N-acetyltransferase [Defluviitaleaceae bacterium]|nr:GNAT family N-acetyltransferase [Defluviitaleaceae bacterium]MCL2837173.1 GNAT family N-acetyltransferase [Defluviitaleaceae bacterium]